MGKPPSATALAKLDHSGVAALLGVDVRTVHRWGQRAVRKPGRRGCAYETAQLEKRLPGGVRAGRVVLFPLATVLAFAAHHGIEVRGEAAQPAARAAAPPAQPASGSGAA